MDTKQKLCPGNGHHYVLALACLCGGLRPAGHPKGWTPNSIVRQILSTNLTFAGQGTASMAYLFNTAEDRQAMLEAIGAEAIEDLFALVPPEFRLSRPL